MMHTVANFSLDFSDFFFFASQAVTLQRGSMKNYFTVKYSMSTIHHALSSHRQHQLHLMAPRRVFQMHSRVRYWMQFELES